VTWCQVIGPCKITEAVPVRTWNGPQTSKSLRRSGFLDKWQMKVAVLSILAPAAFTLLIFISVTGWIGPRAIVQPEGLSKSGNEPAPFRLVAQCLKHLRHLDPLRKIMAAIYGSSKRNICWKERFNPGAWLPNWHC